jgi:hypothetical protein
MRNRQQIDLLALVPHVTNAYSSAKAANEPVISGR